MNIAGSGKAANDAEWSCVTCVEAKSQHGHLRRTPHHHPFIPGTASA